MKRKLSFFVNDSAVQADLWEGKPALDYIRGTLNLTGTKEGCREGDCGACAVLLGEALADGSVRYRTAPSCLLALGELDARHLITIEGLSGAAPDGITPVMRAFLEENASQCGFCSPGFIISLTGWLMDAPALDMAGAVVAVEGNLCRCTGYGAIRRAAQRLIREFAGLPAGRTERIAALVEAKVIPHSVADFARYAAGPVEVATHPLAPRDRAATGSALRLGGGTDWYVRNPEPEETEVCDLLDRDPSLGSIKVDVDTSAGAIEIGAAVTVRDFFESPVIRAAFPGIERFERDVASILIRNRATLGGNIANASPVADMTAMLMAMGTVVRLGRSGGTAGAAPGGLALLDSGVRELPLEDFFLGYKKLDMGPDEFISALIVTPCGPGESFNFEKIAKRRSLDIAAVNTAMRMRVSEGRIVSARVSAGGAAAVPLLLAKTSAWLAGKPVTAATAREAAALAASEVSPMSDVRGSAGYRLRLARRLVLAHFIALFPDSGIAQELFP